MHKTPRSSLDELILDLRRRSIAEGVDILYVPTPAQPHPGESIQAFRSELQRKRDSRPAPLEPLPRESTSANPSWADTVPPRDFG